MSKPIDAGVAAKIKSLDELGRVSADAKARGRKVVLAHGTFDLLHVGHVRHLEAARQEGDLLIVTITADAFVNKGPGRPVFNHHLRSEMLAALAIVDFVGINEARTSENVLAIVQPSIYVKGSDYANPEEDVTGGIAREKAVVERHGGKLVLTNDITFSSSALLNRHFDVFEPELKTFLEECRSRSSVASLTGLIDKAATATVVLVGDTIIDEYVYVSPLGKPSKENVIATLAQDDEFFCGGIVAAANHVAGIAGQVDIVTSLGMLGVDFEPLIRRVVHENVSLHRVKESSKPTTRKQRFVDQAYTRKLFEVYHMNDTPLAPEREKEMLRHLAEVVPSADAVIITDFGHGLMTPGIIDYLSKNARFLAVNAQTNAGNQGFNLVTKYKRADYICIDAPEARLAVGDKFADAEALASRLLPSQIDCPNIIVTNGRHGCFAWNKDQGVHHIPAFTKTVVDTVGAGDAFLAVTSPLVALGGRIDEVAFVGNVAGALKVGIIGHRRSVEKVAMLKYIQTLLK